MEPGTLKFTKFNLCSQNKWIVTKSPWTVPEWGTDRDAYHNVAASFFIRSILSPISVCICLGLWLRDPFAGKNQISKDPNGLIAHPGAYYYLCVSAIGRPIQLRFFMKTNSFKPSGPPSLTTRFLRLVSLHQTPGLMRLLYGEGLNDKMAILALY